MAGGLPLVCCLLVGLSCVLFQWKNRFRMGLDRKVEMLMATAENVLHLAARFQGNNPHFTVGHCSTLEKGTQKGVVFF